MTTGRLKQLQNLEESNPSDPFIKFAIAQEFQRSGALDSALEYYDHLMRHHPDYVGTYYHAGQVYEQLGQQREALQVYERGLQISLDQKDNHNYSELKMVHDSLKTSFEE